ncbi:SPRY domain-containing protein [Pseudomassariella vexata]|uniref:SPRY domain-containing protein n=1 Tax=Pseudomassariella vexata TaxID=1141098 RepID=A0A1Y2EB07_9PEZI|nr:SPRY domain-containing protein [Pseudomassariella vexata]ORY68750.1 SPRY domain-containing protein [Pseudomassariella vexata]
MTNPFQHGSSGLPPDVAVTGFLPRIRSSYASVVSGSNPNQPTSSHPPFNRLSHLLNPPHDFTSDLYSTHHSSSRSRSHNLAYNHQSHAMDVDRNASSQDAGAPSLRPAVPQLPSFSRAFEVFMSGGGIGDSFWASPHRNNGFFTPSYLRGTTYIQKLEEAHKTKQAQKEGQQQAGGGGLQTSQTTPSPINSKSGFHLGMAYDLIERPPSFEYDESIAPLPTKWNKDDKNGGLEVLGDGQEVKYVSSKPPGERDYEACAIRANHAMPAQAGLYYFEVVIVSRKRDDTTVCVGFMQKDVSLARQPGWEADSYGYHGDDGQIFHGQSVGKHYGPPFSTGDTIGCGINFKTGVAFFTKNGVNLGTAFRDVKGKVYPVIGLKRTGEHIRVNFGHTPFVYDIDGMMKQEQAKIRKAISETSTENLTSPPMSETELIQQLILQFLQHDGYVESARAFAEEIHAEQEALTIDPDAHVEGINIKDDEDANRRQRIRRAVLEGDIDKAHKYTNTYYPEVLKENEQVYFRLRCRKFIEMIRKSAEVNQNNNNNNGISKQSNGRSIDDNPNEMDLDENGYSDQMETEDGPYHSASDQDALLNATIEYGRVLQEEFKDDPRREVSKALGDVYALLAYPNPFEVKEVAHLLDRRGRVAVAEELNSAILQSLGKSSRSALETLYGQTTVLLDYLREDGGSGAFVTIQSVVDEIPKQQPF